MFPNGSNGNLAGFGPGGGPRRGGGRAPGRGGGPGRGDGQGNGRGRGPGAIMGRGRGRGNNQMSIDALLAQESRRLMPVLNPSREDGTIWFGLDNEPRRAIVAAIRRHFDGAWINMRSVPNWGLIQWWADFIQCFYWDQAHGDAVYRLWYQVVAARLRDMVSKAKISGKRPNWISREIWNEMLEYWNTDEAKKKSKIAAANRERGESSRTHAVSRISLERQLTSVQEQLASVLAYMQNHMGAGDPKSTNNPGEGTHASVTSPDKRNNNPVDNPAYVPEAEGDNDIVDENADNENVDNYLNGDDYAGGAPF